MATTVNNAFEEFMRDVVNLEADKTSTARKSRDNLIDNINGFSGESDFFKIYESKNLKFGSFARKTKIRELDDIDLMLCIAAGGVRTYFESSNCVHINGDMCIKCHGMINCLVGKGMSHTLLQKNLKNYSERLENATTL